MRVEFIDGILEVKERKTGVKTYIALSLTELGKTVGGEGLGESQESCVEHTEFEVPFGNLNWNISLWHSGERSQLKV